MANDYGAAHRAARQTWAPIVEAGGLECRRGDRCLEVDVVIHPGQAWDLGHPDDECQTPTAPEHEACNRATARRRPDRRPAELHPALRGRASE